MATLPQQNESGQAPSHEQDESPITWGEALEYLVDNGFLLRLDSYTFQLNPDLIEL